MKRIYIADDDAAIRQFMELALGDSYDVETYKTGDLLVQRIEDGDLPDLVMTDTDMPGMRGYDVCSEARKRNILVIGMSGHDVEGARSSRYLRLGAVDFLEKPFPLKDLLGKVENVLNEGESQETE
jgi:DNA-binding response OmpR family regulator|tara:strand:+ start:318 stop:695 length:378 start_codon:yes stop_codon:yes gene_type:complete